jgi:molybdenum cofactor cytidylyltransferase
VLIGLADQIAITQPILKQLLDVASNYPNYIVAAQYNGGVGAPVIFPKQYFSNLSELKGDKGAKMLLLQNSQQTISVPIPEASLDIDTLDDLRLLSPN